MFWKHCSEEQGSWLEQEKLEEVAVLARPFQTAPCPSGLHPRSMVQKLSIYAQPALACLMAVILVESPATHNILPSIGSLPASGISPSYLTALLTQVPSYILSIISWTMHGPEVYSIHGDLPVASEEDAMRSSLLMGHRRW